MNEPAPPVADTAAVRAALPESLREDWLRIEALAQRIRAALAEDELEAARELAREHAGRITSLVDGFATNALAQELRAQALKLLLAANDELQHAAQDRLLATALDASTARERRRGIDAYHAQQEPT
ncbi:MAG: hypothetical protein CALGDGBN_01176 [Pseudomonadales bacterium]|nr:hypothetical protein [Pseudomonadales bacterium]